MLTMADRIILGAALLLTWLLAAGSVVGILTHDIVMAAACELFLGLVAGYFWIPPFLTWVISRKYSKRATEYEDTER